MGGWVGVCGGGGGLPQRSPLSMPAQRAYLSSMILIMSMTADLFMKTLLTVQLETFSSIISPLDKDINTRFLSPKNLRAST